jgi:hypothetical protein
MHTAQRKRSALLGHVLGAGVAAAAISALAIFAGAGSAASQAKPVNTSLPTISGTLQVGSILQGHNGDWDNNPTDFDYFWLRCDKNGHGCSFIPGANGKKYKLTSADVGHTIRFRAVAKNADGSTIANSDPTSVVVASSAKPVNTSLPTISGTAVEGKTLAGTLGTWANNPTSYRYSWLRCAKTGGSCHSVSGATSRTYVLTSADVGNTLRFWVIAANAAGQTGAVSLPTAVVQKAAAPPPPSRGPGCPSGSGNPDQVSAISPPARLLVDTLSSDPHVVTGGTQTLVVKFHVTSTCGGPVQGALVYATATPYNQFSIPPETPTGADGWATLTFQRLSGFPVSRHQQLIAMFVRARKAGENLLLGISTRRLVSIRVDLRR